MPLSSHGSYIANVIWEDRKLYISYAIKELKCSNEEAIYLKM